MNVVVFGSTDEEEGADVTVLVERSPESVLISDDWELTSVARDERIAPGSVVNVDVISLPPLVVVIVDVTSVPLPELGPVDELTPEPVVIDEGSDDEIGPGLLVVVERIVSRLLAVEMSTGWLLVMMKISVLRLLMVETIAGGLLVIVERSVLRLLIVVVSGNGLLVTVETSVLRLLTVMVTAASVLEVATELLLGRLAKDVRLLGDGIDAPPITVVKPVVVMKVVVRSITVASKGEVTIVVTVMVKALPGGDGATEATALGTAGKLALLAAVVELALGELEIPTPRSMVSHRIEHEMMILTCAVRLGESNRSVCITLVLARLIGAISNSVKEVGIRAVTLDISVRTMELIQSNSDHIVKTGPLYVISC